MVLLILAATLVFIGVIAIILVMSGVNTDFDDDDVL